MTYESGEGADTITRSMSGGNQQKAIVAREISRDHDILLAGPAYQRAGSMGRPALSTSTGSW
ncbi:MAG: hypothetical protein ACLTBV_29980 [Enterocloster bolteae]